MFAIRQAARCTTQRLQTSVAPILVVSGCSALERNKVRQEWPLHYQFASFSSSPFISSVVQQTKGPSLPSPAEILPAESEPDVLYHKIGIEIRCADPAVLRSYNKFITLTAGHLDLNIAHNEVHKKPHKKRWTVLKSRFVHKKHLVSYEVRTYHHVIHVVRITGSTADTFLEYIQRNLPEGVSMKVERVRMERLPDHLLTPPSSE